jgi:hypothetical protein
MGTPPPTLLTELRIEPTWYCRFLAPESVWQADPIARTGKPRTPQTAALQFARARLEMIHRSRIGRAIVECQGSSTLYHVHLTWIDDNLRVERIDRVG